MASKDPEMQASEVEWLEFLLKTTSRVNPSVYVEMYSCDNDYESGDWAIFYVISRGVLVNVTRALVFLFNYWGFERSWPVGISEVGNRQACAVSNFDEAARLVTLVMQKFEKHYAVKRTAFDAPYVKEMP